MEIFFWRWKVLKNLDIFGIFRLTSISIFCQFLDEFQSSAKCQFRCSEGRSCDHYARLHKSLKVTYSCAVEHKLNNCHLITQVKQPNQLAHFSFYSFRVWTCLRFLVVFHPGSGRFKQTASGDEVDAFRERVFVRPFIIVGTTIRHCSCTAQSGLEWLICWLKN